jgi:4-diphosphocytidyl-2-C-methyl-D-erythritol kinase
MMSISDLTLPSFAKINLSLRVLGKRRDGYHEVRTVLQTISLHDELEFVLRDDDQIVIDSDNQDVPSDENNLSFKAAKLLRERYGKQAGLTVRLTKKIPPRGGLGGASSNAAITLLALAKLWNLNLSHAELAGMGAELGSDVPFFLTGGRALATGTGTELKAMEDLPVNHLVVATPNASISTAIAYANLKAPALTTNNSAPILSSSRGEPDLSGSDQWPLHNDFETVIFEIEPEIKRVHVALLDAGARGVLLAGSGSSVFGIFDSVEAQRCALEEIQAEPGWRIFPCDTLSRGDYLQALGACGNPLLRSSKMR